MDLTRRFATLLGLLGLWLQLMAPALALPMPHRAPDPFAVICHASVDVGTPEHRRGPLPHPPTCDHCPLCHAATGAIVPDQRPSFTRLDYPVSCPQRWRPAAPFAVLVAPDGEPRPRGPPNLV